MPVIRQFMVGRGDDIDDQSLFELKLLVIRKQIERAVAATALEQKDDFYISSLSCNRLVYKGLIMARQLQHFYHDLADPAMVTSFALVHSRFSTNTLGSWKLAHPYRFIIHNGEINTLRGNINWMTARERQFVSPLLGEDVRKLVPVSPPGQSDTATLDNALEVLLATGRSLEHSMMMLIPEAWGDHIPMDQAKRDFYEYHSSMMEPWDGPALVIGTDGSKVCAVLDRNGLRPCRYLVTTDDLLVMGSETGVLDVPPEKVLYKERIYPGRMFMIDTSRGEIVQDAELKAELGRSAALRPVDQAEHGGVGLPAEAAEHQPPRPRHAPSPPGCVRVQPRRPPRDTGAHGRERRRAHRFDGQRFSAGRTLRELSPPVRLLQAAIRPGQQSAPGRHARGACDLNPRDDRLRAQPFRRDPGTLSPAHAERASLNR